MNPREEKLDLPTYQDVKEASEILKGVANWTPVQTSRILNKELGIDCFIKCENFQRMGAFKFRGGYNALQHLSEKQKQSGVLTFSSGNHAQAIALSASLLNIKATIIMPRDAPSIKVEATKGYGGRVIPYDRYKEDRKEIAEKLQQKSGSVIIPPYDHKHVIAGQGTAAKELFETIIMEAEEKESKSKNMSSEVLEYLFVCVGGGGLISGCALAAHEFEPSCKVIGVEPEAGNDAQQSLAQNKIVRIDTPQTIADGAQTQFLGKLTYAIMKQHVDKIITVSDQELVECMRFFGETMKMIVEPTGCLGLAGLKKLVRLGEIPPNSKCGVIISGGNVDMKRYCELIT